MLVDGVFIYFAFHVSCIVLVHTNKYYFINLEKCNFKNWQKKITFREYFFPWCNLTKFFLIIHRTGTVGKSFGTVKSFDLCS